MKKVQSELNDWLRPEYKRSDFGEITRGKYASRIRASTNSVSQPGNAADVLKFLQEHRLPDDARPSAEEIEAQILEARQSCDKIWL